MKTSRFIFALTTIAVAFASCKKENSPIQESNEKAVSFIAESIETKTAFGTKDGDTYPTLWTENDEKVKISLNLATPKDADVTPSSDKKTATFAGTFTDDKSGSYAFYSVSPASAALGANKSYKSWTIELPASQTPTAASVDEAAQILVAKSTTYNSWPSKVSFSYSHFTAYGKMALKNLNLQGATISSVSLTAAENWAGRWYYYAENSGEYQAGDIQANSASKTITINTSSTSDIWFACAPVDLSGKKITVTVNTTNGTFTKVITWPAGKPFKSGKIYKFSVNMDGITPVAPKVYTKVTNTSEITVDSELIIVANAYGYAISTTQNSNNRAQAAVTKNENTISDPGTDVQVFKAKAGSKNNTIAFYTGSGYIYAASSSSNWLRTQETNNDNSSFSLTIDNGKASLVAQGANTRNTLRYNNQSSCFSCYSSGQEDINIYKLNGSGTTTPIFENIPVTGVTIDETASVTIGGTKTLTATIAPENATNKKVTWTSSNESVATVDNTGKVTGIAAGTATITVKTEDGSFTDTCEVTVTSVSGTTVTYAQTSCDAASVSSGTAPDGSSVTFNNTYTTNKQQLTQNNFMKLTLKGYKGKKITGITLSMKSNKSTGAGYLSVTAGLTVLASIGSSESGVKFNDPSWHGSWSTTYVDVIVTIDDKTHVIADGEDVTITIGATANSLYCQSFTITYE